MKYGYAICEITAIWSHRLMVRTLDFQSNNRGSIPLDSTKVDSTKQTTSLIKKNDKRMVKVNFTKEHYAKLKELAFNMLMQNGTIQTKFGQALTIVDLMHTQTVNTLNSIRVAIGKSIEDLENKDEWVASDVQQETLKVLKERKELVNLIIGWKRYNEYARESNAKKEELKAQLSALKESQKTPEDKIKELEAKLAEFNTVEEF